MDGDPSTYESDGSDELDDFIVPTDLQCFDKENSCLLGGKTTVAKI